MTETMELLHCTTCDQDKPLDQMRKDSRSPTGYRQQCKACKQARDNKRPKGKPAAAALSEVVTPPPALVQPIPGKSKPMKVRTKAEKLAAEDRLYPCIKCERDDVPFDEMTKDKRKFMGVGSWCKACRRDRDAEMREESRRKQQEEAAAAVEREKAKRGHYGDEWEYCYRCNSKARPGVLRQPPSLMAASYPDDALLCANCVGRALDRSERVTMERKRLGIPADASRKQLESAARVAALRELAQSHQEEFRRLFNRNLDAIGVEVEKKWITL